MSSPAKKIRKDTGFSLVRALGRFTGCFLAIVIIGSIIYYCVYGNIFLIGSVICGLTCYVAGMLALITTWLTRRRYGIGLSDTLVAAGVRTGIPMIGALVIFALLDNNILNKAILSLAGYYLALFPFEVTLSVPRGTTQASRPAETNPQDETNP